MLGDCAMLDSLSSTTWKLISVFLLMSVIASLSGLGVKSCSATKKDNERLETINALKEDMKNMTCENNNLNKQVEGLSSEVKSLRELITGKDAEIKALQERQITEMDAVQTGKKLTETIYETVKDDEQACGWFDEPVPKSILDTMHNVGTGQKNANKISDSGSGMYYRDLPFRLQNN